MLVRGLGFSCFLCAAFAWVPPFIDRAGLAALGFAFVALTVGRGTGVPRPSTLARGLRPAGEEPLTPADIGAQLRESLAAYGMAGGTGLEDAPGSR